MEQGAVAGDWECLRILGKGSYGVVGLWKHKNGDVMAVKKFEVRSSHPPPSARMLADLQARYKKEVIMMYDKIENPHVVATIPAPAELTDAICGSGSTAGNNRDSKYEPVLPLDALSPPGPELPLLCMEYCCGGDLRQMLKRPENLSGLPESEVRSVLANISDAIFYLHSKEIIHRDIKPENIVIQRDEFGKNIYKLSDLGFAKDVSGSESLCSTFLGTLPYLAPEIYIGQGQEYGKPVDYWSFGLIAFEICCGNRPFMPGESPAVWIPFVAKKPKEVIAVYRNDNGKIEQSRDIPYKTRLSELFRKCIVAWLPSMLQYDPAKRGKYVLTAEDRKSGTGDSSALTRLQNLLKTKFVEVWTNPERHVYAIGRSTKMSEVLHWVARDTQVAEENQLLLTQEGAVPQREDLAATYMEKGPLYLIPKTEEQISLKMKLPRVLATFLNNFNTVSANETNNHLDVNYNKKIWIAAIYYIQVQFERTRTLWHMSESLGKFYRRSCTEELQRIGIEIDKRIFSLNNLVELDETLEAIELNRGDFKTPECLKTIAALKEEGSNLKTFYAEEFTGARLGEVSLNLKSNTLHDIEEKYQKILKAYENWKADQCSMENLVRLVYLFSTAQHNVLPVVSENIKALLEQLPQEDEKKQKIQILLSQFNALIDQVMQRRVKKQKLILESALPSPRSSPKAFNSAGNNNRMSQSLVQSSSSGSNSSLNESPSLPKKMSQSFTNGSLRRNSFAPDFIALMEETQSIQLELDASISDALAQVEAVKNEKSKMDWSFLQK